MLSHAQIALAALEAACRAKWNEPQSILGAEFIEVDDAAVRYGPTTADIQRHAGQGITMYQIRSHLNYATHDGRVLRMQRRDRGVVHWWPVGMLDKLRAESRLACDDERALQLAQESGAA